MYVKRSNVENIFLSILTELNKFFSRLFQIGKWLNFLPYFPYSVGILWPVLYWTQELTEGLWESITACYMTQKTFEVQHGSQKKGGQLPRYSLFFLLRHFGHWTISVSCLTAALILAVTVFFRLYFQTFWLKWLNVFWLFQNHFSQWPQMTEKKQPTVLYIFINFDLNLSGI